MSVLLFGLFFAVAASTCWLCHLNRRHVKLHGGTIPEGFESVITPEILAKSTAYTLDSNRLDLLRSLFNNTLLVLFLFSGLLPLFDRLIQGVTDSFIARGILFFLLLSWIRTILDIPFSLYGTFVVEERYGFNNSTMRLWFSDLLKSQTIGAVMLGLTVAVCLSLVQLSPMRWWLWVWVFLAIFSLFVMYLSPYVMEPLFNKFVPVRIDGLQEKIEAVMAKEELTVSQIMQKDSSKRSRHSDACLSGLGKKKRIVLHDTLLQQMTHDEIVAVLAHEIGHWKQHHILKRLFMIVILMFAGCWFSFLLLQWPGLPRLTGFENLSFSARLVVLGFISLLIKFPLSPLWAWLCRRDEYAVDRYACKITGNSEALISALIKHSAENLSNLHPHPIYARFYFSHPPVVERVRYLRELNSCWGTVSWR